MGARPIGMRSQGLAAVSLGLLVGCAKAQLTPTPEATREMDANRELTADQQVYQALTRLSFGPKPGDVARVRTMGVDRWIALQLAPDRVDDRATDLFVADHFAITSESPSSLESE